MARTRTKKKERRKASATRRAETHKTGFDSTSINLPDDVGLFKLKESGTKRIDVINYITGKGNEHADEGEEYYERTFFVHRGIGANKNSYICPARTSNKKCPICEAVSKMAQDPDADEDVMKDLRPKERQLFNVIDLDDKEKGIQLWDMSFHLFGKSLDRKLRDADEEDKEAYEDFADPAKGMTVRIGVEEKTFGGNSFYTAEDIELKIRKKQYSIDLLDEAYCLDDLLKVESYETLKGIYLQEDEDEELQEDEEVAPKPKKKKPAKKKKAEPVEEEEDDDWDDDVEDEVEDEVEEDDDDDWDDEDDEEPEPVKKKPVKKKAAKKKPAKKKAAKKKKAEPVEEEEDDDWDDDVDDWDDDE